MRLLFITAEPCPTFRADVAALFGKYLPRHGIHSDLVTGRAPAYVGPVEWGGGDTLLCDIAGGQTKKHLKTLVHGIRQLFAADRTRYDAIQVRDMPVLATFGLLAARLKGLPFFYWMSFPMPEGQIELARERRLSAGLMKFLFPWISGRVGRFLLYRWVLRRADHVFVQSERMKEDLAALGIHPIRMTPVPMGVDLESVQLDAIEPIADARLHGRRALVYLGNMDRPRRIEILFEILARVRQTVPEAMLILVGDTEDPVHRTWLKQQANESIGADDILWTGWLPMKEGWRYVRAAELAISIFPRGSLLDSASPTKVPEYMALRIPVLCNDNPDQAAVVQDSGAGMCLPFSTAVFATAIVESLLRHDSANEAMLNSGTDYVKLHRSYDRISSRLAEVYRNVAQ
jgi:glycosyltransferase involved in cell wall biosynthesis